MDEQIKRESPKSYCVDLIIPCLNEEETAPYLVGELEEMVVKYKAKSSKKIDFTIIIIDDRSQDATKDVFKKLLKDTENFKAKKIISLSRNFGKEAALYAGLNYSDGDACVILDADLQDPPTLIYEMIDAWVEGNKVVNAVRKNRSTDGLLKKVSARAFYTLFKKASHLDVQFDASDFRLLDREVRESILACKERIRFSKGFFAWVGYKQTNIYFKRPERLMGKSKWGGWKLWNYALDGIFNFSTAPLRIWSYIGAVVTISSFIYGIFILMNVVLFGIDLPGYASIMIMITFISGLQLAGIGILGEYIGRIYMETKKRPHYIARDVVEMKDLLTDPTTDDNT